VGFVVHGAVGVERGLDFKLHVIATLER
jgi:hypothetical protein